MLAKDRLGLTMQALSTLYEHTDPETFNLTIVDDESRAVSEGYLALMAAKSNCTVLRNVKSKKITGQVRNLAVYWAERYWGRGDFLYLSDNDVYFTKDWLVKLAGLFRQAEKSGFKLLGACNHPFLGSTGCEPVVAGNEGFILHAHDAVAGVSQLMRWFTWDKYGPLDAHAVGVGQSEDWAFCQKIVQDGFKVGSIAPFLVWDCAATNSYGEPATGAGVIPRLAGALVE